jgi:uncharacterized damage-inducible protein DinB
MQLRGSYPFNLRGRSTVDSLAFRMHPRLAELVEYAQLQRQAVLAAVSAVPESERSRRPDSSVWSVAEVLEHLHRVESGIARLVGRSIEKGRQAGAQPEQDFSSLMHSLDSLQLTDRDRFFNAPDTVLPRGELTAQQALVALDESRRQLLHAIGTGEGLALTGMVYPHPLAGMLNLYQWILFVGHHEGRHSEQIREIGRSLDRQPS